MAIGDKRHPSLDDIARGPNATAPRTRRAGPEHRIQAELIERARDGAMLFLYPALADLHAIPNGGKRGAATAAKMKREGVLRGVPDLFLPVPKMSAFVKGDNRHPTAHVLHGLYLETKAPGGTLTPEQRAFMQRAASRGYACATYRSADEGIALLMLYLSGEWEQSDGMFR